MKKILLIKQGALGDIVMTTPLLESIQQYHPGDDLWIMTTPEFVEIFRRWSGINVKSIPRKGIHNVILAIAWIRKNHFNRIYDLQSSDRTSVLCALSGAPERIGNHPHYPYNIHPAESFKGQCHIFEHMQKVLASADVDCICNTPILPTSQDEKKHVSSWLEKYNLLDTPFVVLHAGASPKHPEKRWPFYMQIGKLLDDRGVRPVWIGAEADVELNNMLVDGAGLNATGIFTLAELVELGRQACFAITNDSGPMHILSCSGIPVYAFFGPTNWRRNHAIGQSQNVITLQPADVTGKTITDPATSDLGNIPVDDVINRLEKDKML